ncbi:cysteine desulfurase [Candidatus Woesearchaeota archaeon]|nr:cysteine desulfurase [Candidatus Woesearchaeota archaeon]
MNNTKRVYLDNAATTNLDKEVLEEMTPFFLDKYGNPSSLHTHGKEAHTAIKEARKTIAEPIGALPEEIIFVGSATEADNMALFGVALANKERGNHIITTKIEHKAVLEPLKKLEKKGFEITYLDVDKQGFIKIDELEEKTTKKTVLVSIIHANHEVGTIQDLERIGKMCKEKKVLFHTDAAQSFTKTELDVEKFNLDLVSLNAHKMHGPKGVGALYIKKGTLIDPLIIGGGQEFKMRAGTHNVPCIVGFSKATEIGMKNMKKSVGDIGNLRDYAIEELLRIPDTRLNGPIGGKRLCNNINISFDFIEGEALLMHLDLVGVAVSTGSACSSTSLRPSHILTAMGRSATEAHGSLRITLSKHTTKQEIDYTINNIKKIVGDLRMLSPLTKVRE